MKIRVLGCSGAEVPGHNPPGFLLNDHILFDAGSLTNVLDMKKQLMIRHIFITHAHLDHIRSIPFLVDNIITHGKSNKVNVISTAPVIKTIQRDLFNSSIWPDFTVIPDPCNAALALVEVKEGKPLQIYSYTITPYKVNHSVPAVGYLVEDERKKHFFYTGDMGSSARTWKKLGNVRIDCLIIETSFPNAMEEMANVSGHLTPNLLRQELSMMTRMPKRIYITHPKPQYMATIKRELEKIKVNNIRLLKEGETIRL